MVLSLGRRGAGTFAHLSLVLALLQSCTLQGDRTRRHGAVSAEEVVATSSGGDNTLEVLDLLGVTDEAARKRIKAHGKEAQVDAQPAQQPSPAPSATGSWAQKQSAQREQRRQTRAWRGVAGSGADVPARLENGRFCNVQRIPAAQFTREQFLHEFEGRQPVILTGATDHWGALHWDFNAMLANVSRNAAHMKQAGVPAATAAKGFADDLADALAPGETPERRARKLVVDGYALSWPGLQAGYDVPEFAVRDGHQNFIEEWRHYASAFGDLIPVLQGRSESVENPAVPVQDRYLITGPAGAGGFPHTDVSNQSFWNALVHGRKRWFFVSAGHRERLLQHDPVTTASWATANTTAYEWFDSGWAEKIAAGWGYEGRVAAELAGRQWWECYQDPGDLVYGPGGTMHAVLSLEDTLSLSEQMLGPADFRGSISYGKAASGGLVEAGWCDASVKDLQIQSLEQLLALGSIVEMASFKGPMQSITAAEIADPGTRTVSLIERVFLTVDWFASCSAVHRVRRDLWEQWDDCATLADSCEAFVRTNLRFRDDYDFYPEVRPREQTGKRGSGRRHSRSPKAKRAAKPQEQPEQ